MAAKVYYVGAGLVDAEKLLDGEIILGLEAIAAGLYQRNRFAGQTVTGQAGYDVLSHSLAVGELSERMIREAFHDEGADLYKSCVGLCPMEDVIEFSARAGNLWGCLHDVTEAIMADVPAPVKRTSYFDAYRRREVALGLKYQNSYLPALWDCRIPQHMTIRDLINQCVHRADTVRLALEAACLLPEDAFNNIMHSDSVAGVSPWIVKEFARFTRDGTLPTSEVSQRKEFITHLRKLDVLVGEATQEIFLRVGI